MYWDFEGVFNCSPMLPRDAGLSDSYKFASFEPPSLELHIEAVDTDDVTNMSKSRHIDPGFGLLVKQM